MAAEEPRAAAELEHARSLKRRQQQRQAVGNARLKIGVEFVGFRAGLEAPGDGNVTVVLHGQNQ